MSDIYDAITNLDAIDPKNLKTPGPSSIKSPSKVKTQTGQTVILNDNTVLQPGPNEVIGLENYYAKRGSNSTIMGSTKGRRY